VIVYLGKRIPANGSQCKEPDSWGRNLDKALRKPLRGEKLIGKGGKASSACKKRLHAWQVREFEKSGNRQNAAKEIRGHG